MRDGRKRDERSSLLADSSFWEGTDLDLGGASLVNAICWVGCRLDFANFNGARFVDGVNFAHAEFGQVFFIDSRFEEGNAHFYNAWFGDRAVFFGTNFGTHEATFKEAHFHGIAFFDDAKFGGGVSFAGAEAFLDFDTAWGSQRTWPAGWREDQDRPATRDRWILVVRDDAATSSTT